MSPEQLLYADLTQKGLSHIEAMQECWQLAYLRACERSLLEGEDQPNFEPFRIDYCVALDIWECAKERLTFCRYLANLSYIPEWTN